MAGLLDKIKGSLNFIERDIKKRKHHFGVELYDYVDAWYQTDKQTFLANDDNAMIATVRPCLLATQREVSALLAKRNKIEAEMEEGDRTANFKRLRNAKLKTQLGILDRQARVFKGDFGQELYDKFLFLQENRQWLPTDPEIRTAYEYCRRDIELLQAKRQVELNNLSGPNKLSNEDIMQLSTFPHWSEASPSATTVRLVLSSSASINENQTPPGASEDELKPFQDEMSEQKDSTELPSDFEPETVVMDASEVEVSKNEKDIPPKAEHGPTDADCVMNTVVARESNDSTWSELPSETELQATAKSTSKQEIPEAALKDTPSYLVDVNETKRNHETEQVGNAILNPRVVLVTKEDDGTRLPRASKPQTTDKGLFVVETESSKRNDSTAMVDAAINECKQELTDEIGDVQQPSESKPQQSEAAMIEVTGDAEPKEASAFRLDVLARDETTAIKRETKDSTDAHTIEKPIAKIETESQKAATNENSKTKPKAGRSTPRDMPLALKESPVEKETVVLRKAEIVKSELTPAELEEVELRKAELIKTEYSWEKPEWADGSSLSLVNRPNVSIEPIKTELSPTSLEKVELRKAEQIKNEYSWERPEWAEKAPLRSPVKETEKESTQSAKTYEWEKPEWARKPVLKSPKKSNDVVEKEQLV